MGRARAYLSSADLLLARGLSPAGWARRQIRLLRKLLDHSLGRVPYFRESWARLGLRPEDIRGPEDWGRLPITDKETLRDLPLGARFASGFDPRSCLSSLTSGTSGQPLYTYFTREEAVRNNAGWIRAQIVGGWDPRDEMVALVGRTSPRQRSWYERFGLMRRADVPIGTDPEAMIRTLQILRPKAVLAYIMDIIPMLEILRGRPGHGLHPKVLFHTSGILEERWREEMQEIFGCRIVDLYGSIEAGCLAWECPRCRGYHLAQDQALIEIVKDGRPALPGETGEVIVTPYFRRAMPYIRYRQGDLVTVSRNTPRCGRPFPLIERIEGRDHDLLRFPGGRYVLPHSISIALSPIPRLERWRVNQDAEGRILVEIACPPANREETEKAVREALDPLLGLGSAWEIAGLDRIPEEGRKFRGVRSLYRQTPKPQ